MIAFVLEWGVTLKGDDSDFDEKSNAEIILDPLFWQAFGKASGWELDLWKFFAHQYFDLVLTSGDTEKFWKELEIVN